MSVTCTRSVLVYANGVLTEDDIVFNSGDDRPSVKIPMDLWKELGVPTAITIAIWPGDRQDLMELSEGNLA